MPGNIKDAPQDRLLFDALSRSDAGNLFDRSAARHFAARKTIFSLGTPGDTMLLIDTGRVEISLTSANGRRSILAQLGPGDIVGEMAVLDGETRSADAVAATDVTGRLLTRTQVLTFLEENPRSAITVIETLCRRLRQTNATLANQTLVDGETRLARVLLTLSQSWSRTNIEGGVQLTAGFSQSDLGDMSGLSRESVNRHLRQWEAQGILSRDNGAVFLHALDDLHDIAKGED